ncbi:MAG: extracellular solute-binding protein [Alphaproteobacteria bacterium]|nr:extracellular solute-binding protein [Alphaproteobacteria bacterium]
MTTSDRKTLLAAKAFNRRTVLKSGAAASAVGFTAKATGPFVRDAHAAELELRVLMWANYNVESTVTAFEQQHGVRFAPTYFDGNSEAFNKMKAGGTQDFDLVQADGHWPRTYHKQGLTQIVDPAKVPNLANAYPACVPPKYTLDQVEGGTDWVAIPNCWGGYGVTINTSMVDAADAESIEVLYNEKYKGHIITSARFEENIAETGILVADRMGTRDAARPDGKPFNPYVLTDEELEECKTWLIKQKGLLLTRYVEYDMVDRLMISGQAWMSPEWGITFRRLLAMHRNGELDWQARHVLKPTEGGLGWIDNWMISSGVEDAEKREICYAWINNFLSDENMLKVLREEGTSSVIDIRKHLTEIEIEDFLLNETEQISGLYMFDQPSSPEKWERVWSEVEAA